MHDTLYFAIIGTSALFAFGFVGSIILSLIELINEHKKDKNNAE